MRILGDVWCANLGGCKKVPPRCVLLVILRSFNTFNMLFERLRLLYLSSRCVQMNQSLTLLSKEETLAEISSFKEEF